MLTPKSINWKSYCLGGILPIALSLGNVFSGVPETGMRDHVQYAFILVLYMVLWVVNKAKHFVGKTFN